MGVKIEDLLNMTWKEFDYYATGYLRRVERQMNNTRQMIAAMYNSSGLSKTKVKPRDVMHLPLLDDVGKAEIIRVPTKRLNKLKRRLNEFRK